MLFVKIVNSFQLVITFAKSSTLDVRLGSETLLKCQKENTFPEARYWYVFDMPFTNALRNRCFKKLAELTGKHLCRSLFFNDLCEKTALAQVVCNFVKFLRKHFLMEHLGRLLQFVLFSFVNLLISNSRRVNCKVGNRK